MLGNRKNPLRLPCFDISGQTTVLCNGIAQLRPHFCIRCGYSLLNNGKALFRVQFRDRSGHSIMLSNSKAPVKILFILIMT